MNSFLKNSAIIILACGLQNAFTMNELAVEEEDADILQLRKEIKQLKKDIKYINNEIAFCDAKKKGEKIKRLNTRELFPQVSIQNALAAYLHTSQQSIKMPSSPTYSKRGNLARYLRRRFNITGVNEIMDQSRGYTLLHAIFNGWIAQSYKDNGLKRPLSKFEMNRALKRSLFALWQWGEDLNRKDNAGNAALHYAARGIYIKAVKFLCTMEGVDVNVQNDEGTTPHHYMLQENKGLVHKYPLDENLKKCYRTFIKADSKIDIENKQGESVNSYVIYTQEQKDNELPLLSWLVGCKATKSDLSRFHSFCTTDEIVRQFDCI